MSRPTRIGFTLIELLIVLGIIAILAAIAVPNFLEAQTRGKVSAAKANLRNLSQSLEAYRIDYNGYPGAMPMMPEDPLGLLADTQLRVLTTPIAYTSTAAFSDPFGQIKSQAIMPSSTSAIVNDFPTLSPPNTNKSMLYYHYQSLARRLDDSGFALVGAAVVSLGPDRTDSLGAYRPFPVWFFQERFGFTGLAHPIDTVYDPTNGVASSGDISRFVGSSFPNDVP